MRLARQETIQPRSQAAVRPDYVVVPTCCGLVVVQFDETAGRRAVAQAEAEEPAVQGAEGFGALSRVAESGEVGNVKRASRPMSELLLGGLSRGMLLRYGLATMTAALVAYMAAVHWVGLRAEEALTVSLLTFGLTPLLLFLHSVQLGAPTSFKDMAGTCGLLAALGLCGLIVLLAAWMPLAAVLQLAPPPMAAWGMIVGLAVTPAIVVRFIETCEARTHGLACAKESNACR